MYYYRRPAHKRVRHYFMPFFMILFLILLVFFGWRVINSAFTDSSRNTINEWVFLDINSGSVKGMASDSSEWKTDNIPDKIYLQRGEKIKTGPDGRASLTFFDKSTIRLDVNSEADFQTLKRKKEINTIETVFPQGSAWITVKPLSDPDSVFTLYTGSLKIDSHEGVLAIDSPNTVYMINGSAQISLMKEGEAVKTYTLGVGQQFMLDEQGTRKIANGQEADVIFAISDRFKTSSWYQWNMTQNDLISDMNFPDEGTASLSAGDTTIDLTTDTAVDSTDTTTDLPSDLSTTDTTPKKEVTILSPKNHSAVNKSTVDISGEYDVNAVSAIYVQNKKASFDTLGKWTAYDVALNREGENVITIETENREGQRTPLSPFVIEYDTIAPSRPEITAPGKNGDSVVLESTEQAISGSVSADTYAVIVDDYRLGKYVPGSKAFEYYAKTVIGNLKAGENTYKIYAEDKAGNRSEATIITLVLNPDVIEKSAESMPTEALPSSSTGGVKITEPNGGSSFTTVKTEFEIKGTAPATAAKILVNDYELSKFKPGDVQWSYRAYASMGNLEIGKKNTYTAKAYDAEDHLLGSASIVIDVESEGSPQITIPTTKSSYLTTLNELVIGGSVGKWVQAIYINDKKLLNYIPGNEKWYYTVQLKPGVNLFSVYGEKDDVKTGSDSIEITYQP